MIQTPARFGPFLFLVALLVALLPQAVAFPQGCRETSLGELQEEYSNVLGILMDESLSLDKRGSAFRRLEIMKQECDALVARLEGETGPDQATLTDARDLQHRISGLVAPGSPFREAFERSGPSAPCASDRLTPLATSTPRYFAVPDSPELADIGERYRSAQTALRNKLIERYETDTDDMTDAQREQWLADWDDARRQLLDRMILLEEQLAWTAADDRTKWSSDEIRKEQQLLEALTTKLARVALQQSAIAESRKELAELWQGFDNIRALHAGLRSVVVGEGDAGGLDKVVQTYDKLNPGVPYDWLFVAMLRAAGARFVSDLEKAIGQKDSRVADMISTMNAANEDLVRLARLRREKGISAIRQSPGGAGFVIHRPPSARDREALEKELLGQMRTMLRIDLPLTDGGIIEQDAGGCVKPFDIDERRILLGDESEDRLERAEEDYRRHVIEEEDRERDSGTFFPKEEVRFQYAAMAADSAETWVGVFPADAPSESTRAYIAYQYLDTEGGEISFTAPIDVGEYQLRVISSNESTISVGVPSEFSVIIDFARSSLTMPDATVFPRQDLGVAFTASPSYMDDAWVGIFPGDTPPSLCEGEAWANYYTGLGYQYLKGETNGMLTFLAPSEEGYYEFRMYERNAANGYEVARLPFAVAIDFGSASLTMPDTTVFPRQDLRVAFTASPSYMDDAWVGIFPGDIPPGLREGEAWGNYYTGLGYQYLKGETEGELTFLAPTEEGSYEFRMYERNAVNGYEVARLPFSVVIDFAAASLKLAKSAYATRESIQVMFMAGWSYLSDAWVGIFPGDAPSGLREGDAWADFYTGLGYQYLHGRTEGVLEFTAPSESGIYELRMYERNAPNGYEVARVAFTVVAPD